MLSFYKHYPLFISREYNYLAIDLSLYSNTFFSMHVYMKLHREVERGVNFLAALFNEKKTKFIQEQLLSSSSAVSV